MLEVTIFDYELYGGGIRKCPLVSITGDDYDKCDAASHIFWANKKSGIYGKGLLNSTDDECRVTRIGLLGQMAFSTLLNIPVDLAYRERGDDYDNIIGTCKIDVKCASRDSNKCYVRYLTETGMVIEPSHDIYIVSYLHEEDRSTRTASIMIVGYMLRKNMMEKCMRMHGVKSNGDRCRHKNYELVFTQTEPMDEIMNTPFDRFDEKFKHAT